MDKKQEIIAAALKLFSLKGYNFTESELAAAADISVSSLNSHYVNKEQIIEAMIRQEIDRYYNSLNEKTAQTGSLSCKDTMREIYYYIIDFFSDYKRLRLWRSIPLIPYEKLQADCNSLINEKDSEFNRQVQLIIFKGLQNGEIRTDVTGSAVNFFFCMIQGILDGMLIYPKNRRENTNADRLFEAYWDNIKANTAK